MQFRLTCLKRGSCLSKDPTGRNQRAVGVEGPQGPLEMIGGDCRPASQDGWQEVARAWRGSSVGSALGLFGKPRRVISELQI